MLGSDKQNRLAGKVAVVTGAGSSGPGIGTGKAISILLARQGAHVLLVDKVLEHAEETMCQIQAEGGSASVFEGDVTQNSMCSDMISTAINRYKKLDILVNNVGIIGKGSVVDVREEDWDNTMEINLKGTMLSCRHAIPAMAANGGGAIINMASIDALRCGSWDAKVPYAASKGAIISMSIAMAAFHGRENIRVNCVAPGFIYTPMVATSLTTRLREIRQEAAPLAKEGDSWDVAWAVLFLASDESRWITGTVLPVDGGLLTATSLTMLPHLQNLI